MEEQSEDVDGIGQHLKEHQFKKGQSGNPNGRPKGSKNKPKSEDMTVYEPPFKVVAGKTAQEVLEKNQTNIAYWLLLQAFKGNEKLQTVLANKVFGSLGGIESESSKRAFKELIRMSKKDLRDLAMEEDVELVSVDGEIKVKEEPERKRAKTSENRPKMTGDV